MLTLHAIFVEASKQSASQRSGTEKGKTHIGAVEICEIDATKRIKRYILRKPSSKPFFEIDYSENRLKKPRSSARSEVG